jgi:hypothetical protein
VQRVEETVGDPQGRILPGAGIAPVQVQTETEQNNSKGDSATPLETGERKHANAEKQGAAEAKAGRKAALTEQDQERQLGLLRDQQELARCLNSGMGILTPEQVRQVANAVAGTNKGPMEALRGLSEQLVALK